MGDAPNGLRIASETEIRCQGNRIRWGLERFHDYRKKAGWQAKR